MQLLDHVCISVRGFRARSAAEVDAFHAAGLASGGADYYAAFLEDPEGSRMEAVFHGGKEK